VVERGSVWAAVVAAVDGSLEVRVAAPGRLAMRRRRRLRELGFAPVFDAWHAPLDATTPDEEAARLLGAVAEDGAERVYEHAGVLDDDRPPPDAPPEAHIAAALRTLVDGRRRGVSLGAGRPEHPWGYVWPVDGELLVQRDTPGRPGRGDDEWREPLTAAGCDAVAAELVRRAEGARSPLFLQLLTHDKERSPL
jgi:hypothetical protein